MGAALVVRREAVNEVGLLDERFKIYYNEVDWCSRIKEARWKIYFVHSAEIVHFGGKTTVMTNPGFEQFEEMNRNCLFYYEKHFGRWAVVVFRLLMATGFASRVILWKLIVLLKDNDKAAYRLEFAKRSFQIGVRFWNVSL
jgi:GT2 family glycosyltransferase